MHLDIPPRRVSQFSLWFLYLKRSVIGVLGPGLVVYAAWRQLNPARTLEKEVQNCGRLSGRRKADVEEQTNAESSRDHSTLVHGFFGSMGGYAFDLGSDCDPQLCQI